MAIHRADFLGEGEGDELDNLDGILEHAVEPKRIGTQKPAFGREEIVLKQRRAWSLEGFTWEKGTRY